MSKWAVLLCEGPHDAEFILALLVHWAGWTHIKRAPSWVPANSSGNGVFYARRGEWAIRIVGLNGVDKVLGDPGWDAVDSSETANAWGVLVDADGVGATGRAEQVKTHFGAKDASFRCCLPGDVVAGLKRRVGFFIAPDNSGNGSLDAVILGLIQRRHPSAALLGCIFTFLLGKCESHCWDDAFAKASLGAVGQHLKAGASLASCLQERIWWVGTDRSRSPKAAALLDFVLALCQD